MIARTIPTVSYGMWLRRILDVHRSRGWDADSSDEGEQAEDELNEVWNEIDEDQKQRLWGLSADLATLHDRETIVESDWPAMTVGELARAQQDAFQSRDWDSLLEHLRRPPRYLERSTVDYLRGRAWMELGHPEVALLFFDNAARLDPFKETDRILALECVKELRDYRELLARCSLYRDDPQASARLLFRSADGFHLYAKHSGQAKFYEDALAAIESGFQKLAQSGEAEAESIVAGAYATKSFCLDSLGRPEEALKVLDEAVQRYPEHMPLLVARGLLRQELGRADAIDDFRLAVSKGTGIAWAYLELARDAIEQGNNENALEMCKRGLAASPSDSVAAFLFDLMAIAMFRLRESPQLIRMAFQRASELNPLNQETRQNLDRFERFHAQRQSEEPKWELVATGQLSGIEELQAAFVPAA